MTKPEAPITVVDLQVAVAAGQGNFAGSIPASREPASPHPVLSTGWGHAEHHLRRRRAMASDASWTLPDVAACCGSFGDTVPHVVVEHDQGDGLQGRVRPHRPG